MQRIISLFIITLGFIIGYNKSVFAQEPRETLITREGKVIDEQGNAIPFATISVYSVGEQKVVGGTTADSEGYFKITYSRFFQLRAEALGYELKVLGDTQLPKVIFQLKEKALETKAIEVKTARQLIRMEPDKIVVDVQNSSMNTGLTAIEVLRRMPGVIIDNNGNISMRGKQGVLVLIDDKPTYLTGDQLKNFLTSLSSTQLAEIELLTQPNAKFDAQGNAGAINIKLKNVRIAGFEGEMHSNAGKGIYTKSNTGGSINYGFGRFKLNAAYDHNWDEDLMDLRVDRTFTTPDGLQTQRLREMYRIPKHTHFAKLGLGYDIAKGHSLAFQSFINYRTDVWRGTNVTNIFDASDRPLAQAVVQDYNPDQGYDFKSALSYRANFAKGTVLSADIDFGLNNFTNSQVWNQEFTPVIGPVENSGFRMKTDPRIGVLAPKIDLSMSLDSNTKLESGLKYITASANVNNDFFTIGPQNEYIFNALTSNTYRYSEHILAAYSQITRNFKDGFKLQIGLRAEQWLAYLTQVEQDINVDRNQFQLFPSIGINKDIGKDNIGIRYSRRIDRPDYYRLNPYSFQMDAYTIWAGNPFLVPQISNNIELNYSTLEGMLNLSASASQFNNYIAGEILVRNDDTSALSRVMPINLGIFRNYSISAFGSVPVTKWFNLDFFFAGVYNEVNSTLNNFSLEKNRAAFNGSLTANVVLPKNWKVELNGFYNTYSLNGIGILYDFGSFNGALVKTFANERASVRFSFTDAFRSMQFITLQEVGNITSRSLYRDDTRVWRIGFTYRFGSSKVEGSELLNRKVDIERMGGR